MRLIIQVYEKVRYILRKPNRTTSFLQRTTKNLWKMERMKKL